jgi:hypothetical protein
MRGRLCLIAFLFVCYGGLLADLSRLGWKGYLGGAMIYVGGIFQGILYPGNRPS